jgi:4-hydroxy-2-oxoheptanedioate aldolase
MSERNTMRRTLEAGGITVGVSCATGNVHAIELFARSDLDYVYLDQQHGLVSFDTLIAQLRCFSGRSTTPLVRVLRNDPGLIGQVLDAGAHGVIVPMVNSVDEAERAVAACRYQPAGVRSWGPLRAAFGLGTDPAVVDGEVLCFVMVETPGGLEQVERIAAVPGVDGIYIGPADLAVSMGLKPGITFQEGAHAAAIARIRAACDAAGTVTGVSGDPIALAEQGFRMVTGGSTTNFLGAGLARVLERRTAARGSTDVVMVERERATT